MTDAEPATQPPPPLHRQLSGPGCSLFYAGIFFGIPERPFTLDRTACAISAPATLAVGQ